MLQKIIIILLLALLLFVLIRKRLVSVDLSFPWFLALVVLGFASVSAAFVDFLAGVVGILFAPLGIVFVTFFISFGLITVLLIGLTVLRSRQIRIVRHLALADLEEQERESS